MSLRVILSLCFVLLGIAGAQETPTPPDAKRAFDLDELGMLPIEREQIANYLAGVAVSDWRQAETHSEELTLWTGRFLAFALALHPGNLRALSAVRSLRQGKLPRALPEEVDAIVLAELLYKRHQLLIEQGGEANARLSVYLLALAVRLAPYHEDAVYQYELNRLKDRVPDWSLVASAYHE